MMGKSWLLKTNVILSFFTATVMFVLLLIVAYTLMVGPCCGEYLAPTNNKRLREIKFLKRDSEIRDDLRMKYNSMKTGGSLSEHRKELTNNYMSLIPDFKRRSQPVSLHRRSTSKFIGSLFKTTPCRDSMCSEYLSVSDRPHYSSCLDSASREKPVPPTSRCKFIDGRERDPVALTSLPGSGNTWVRQILETITGICTGAIYCDVSLRSSGFTGESVREGSVLVVKTHENYPSWTGSAEISYKLTKKSQEKFGSAVFLIRNPLNALVAEWNRKVANNFTIRTTNLNSHTEKAGKEWFGDNPTWNEFVMNQASRWKAMLKNWVIKNVDHPVLMVKYESLQSDTFAQSKRILDYLGVSYNAYQVENLLKNGMQTFHRNHSDNFEHYTEFQRSYVKSIVEEAIELLRERRIADEVNITDYLLI